MSTVKITALTEENTCNFCNNALAKYSCPKCNQLYCALTCYQSEQHLSCSEQFYKDLVQEHLATQSKDESNKETTEKKMQEILQQFHQQNLLDDDEGDEEDLDSDDDDDNTTKELSDLGARLNGINLDDSEEVWKNLTEAERKDFEQFLQSGDVAQFMAMWTPWWEFRSSTVLDDKSWSKCKSDCPKITKIKSFNEISSKPPASCMENNMINVLSGYVFLQRYFNGEVKDFEVEFSMFLWNLSLNLKENVNFDTGSMAIESIFQQCLTNADLGITTDKENQRHVKADINCILGGPHASERNFYILAAFSDLKSILSNAKSTLTTQESNKSQPKGQFYEQFTAQQSKVLETFTKENITAAKRKVDYYLSFVQDLYRV